MSTPEGIDALPDTKNAKIMFGVFAVLTLLFTCGGGLMTGIAASGRESDGVNAAMAMMGPSCCSMSGLLMAGISLFLFKNNKIAQLVAPIAAGVAGGFFGGFGIVLFFTAIWPAL